MNNQLLRDKEIYPDNKILELTLGDIYPVYNNFTNIITDDKYNLELQWNYYNDGKAWLCKVVYKKKTVFWLSIWAGYFKTSFFFTQKNDSGIKDLNIDESIKESYYSNKAIGKLKPLILDINTSGQLHDVLEIINYKKNLK